MRRSTKAVRRFGAVIPRLGNVQIQKVDSSLVLFLEPVHDGGHGAAPESIGVEELEKLRTPRRGEYRDVARVIPHIPFPRAVSSRKKNHRGAEYQDQQPYSRSFHRRRNAEESCVGLQRASSVQEVIRPLKGCIL